MKREDFIRLMSDEFESIVELNRTKGVDYSHSDGASAIEKVVESSES